MTVRRFNCYRLCYVRGARRVALAILLIAADSPTRVHWYFRPDVERVLQADPTADIEFIKAFRREFIEKLSNPEESPIFVRQMLDSFSSLLVIEDLPDVETDQPDVVLQRIVSELLADC